jgi:hypothetical protein
MESTHVQVSDLNNSKLKSKIVKQPIIDEQIPSSGLKLKIRRQEQHARIVMSHTDLVSRMRANDALVEPAA